MTRRRERPFVTKALWPFTVSMCVVVGLVVGLAACVRLNEPERFSCRTDADCLASETCRTDVSNPGTACWPEGSCSNDHHCGDDEVCGKSGRCREVECTERSTTCGNHLCNLQTHECLDPCAAGSDCRSGHACLDGACIPLKSTGQRCERAWECSTDRCCINIDDGHAFCSAFACTGELAKLPLDAECAEDGACHSGCCAGAGDGEPGACAEAEACGDPAR